MVHAMETRMSMHQPLQVGASLLFMVIQALGEEVVKSSPNCLVVSTSSKDEEFIGAEVGSNNTAELSGLFAALRWLLTEENDDAVLIRLDSQYAGNIATGAWRAKANRELAARVQSVWNEVASQRELSWSHVRAHRGHRWNERADHLAKRAMRRERPLPLTFWKPGQD